MQELQNNLAALLEWARSCTWYYSNDPADRERRARNIIRRMKTKTSLVSKPCILCHTKRTIMYHPDYTKPGCIIWLCRSCCNKVQSSLCLLEEFNI